MAESMQDINDPAKIAERKAALARQTAASKTAREPVTQPKPSSAARSDEPSQSRQITLSGQRQTVVVWMLLAFLIYTIGRSPDKVELPPSQQLGAWGVLAIMLAILVDMDETAEVGKALTMLLLVSILLLYGDGVIKWVNAKVGANPEPPTKTPIAGKVVAQ